MRDKLGETLKKKLWEEYGGQKAEDTPPSPRRTARETATNGEAAQGASLVQWLGGLVSLALVVGVVYWVFELGRRDATEVPVIQAMVGAARELPQNSGGPQVDNQGLQVNEVLGSDATAPVEPQTTLAPPPQRVVAADVTPPVEATPTSPILVPVTPAQTPPPATPLVAAAPLFPSLPGADPDMTRPVRRVQAAALSGNADLLSDAIASAILEATTGTAPAESTPTPAPAVTPAPVAAPSYAGEKMIQLGAYDDEESANRDYDLLLEDNQDLMGQLVRFVERREAGGRVFYRLRARGFTSMEEATDMCAALLARSVQCIAVTAR